MVVSPCSHVSFLQKRENVDPHSLSCLPFSEWAVRKVASSVFLNPPRYQLRPIEDRGSISASLKVSKIKFSDRIHLQNQDSILAKLGRMILRPYLFNLIGSPIGFCYHGLSILRQSTLDGVRMCVSLAFQDLSDSLLSFVSLSPYILHLVGLDGRKEDLYGYKKSLFLRNEFGIVGKEGDLLTWHPTLDEDFSFNECTKWSQVGDFQILYKNLGLEYLDELYALHQRLPSQCKMALLYPPLSTYISDFLNQNKEAIVFSDTEIKEWEEKFKKLDSCIEDIVQFFRNENNYLMEEEWGSSIYPEIAQFPLSKTEYFSHFKSLIQIDSFFTSLGLIVDFVHLREQILQDSFPQE